MIMVVNIVTVLLMYWKCSKTTDTQTGLISPSFIFKTNKQKYKISNTVHFLFAYTFI